MEDNAIGACDLPLKNNFFHSGKYQPMNPSLNIRGVFATVKIYGIKRPSCNAVTSLNLFDTGLILTQFIFAIPTKSRATELKHLRADKKRRVPAGYRVDQFGLGPEVVINTRVNDPFAGMGARVESGHHGILFRLS